MTVDKDAREEIEDLWWLSACSAPCLRPTRPMTNTTNPRRAIPTTDHRPDRGDNRPTGA